jgi:hypothetical protein
MNDWHDIACLSRLKKKKKKFTHWQYLTNNWVRPSQEWRTILHMHPKFPWGVWKTVHGGICPVPASLWVWRKVCARTTTGVWKVVHHNCIFVKACWVVIYCLPVVSWAFALFISIFTKIQLHDVHIQVLVWKTNLVFQTET